MKNKRTLLIVLIIIVLIVGGIVSLYLITNGSSNGNEYKLGKDTIKSVGEVVGEVKVSSIFNENKQGVQTKKIEFKSSNPQEEILMYIDYLINEAGFTLTSPVDMLNYSSIKLSKDSLDTGKTLLMSIHYGDSDYTIVIQKK